MRCYFLRRGHIAAVKVLGDLSDEAAIEQAVALFEERKQAKQEELEGFELWDRARFVYRYPLPAPKHAVDPKGSTTGGHGEAA